MEQGLESGCKWYRFRLSASLVTVRSSYSNMGSHTSAIGRALIFHW